MVRPSQQGTGSDWAIFSRRVSDQRRHLGTGGGAVPLISTPRAGDGARSLAFVTPRIVHAQVLGLDHNDHAAGLSASTSASATCVVGVLRLDLGVSVDGPRGWNSR